MPDPYSIPFRQAESNGHYLSKQLPNDRADFLVVLGLPSAIGNVTSATLPSQDKQLAFYYGSSGMVIAGSVESGVVDLVDGKVTVRLSPQGDIVGTVGAQTLDGKTLTNCLLTAPAGLTKADVGLPNVDNTSDAAKPISTATQTALDLKQNLGEKGNANGYAGLDGTAKVPTSQLPASVLGTTKYQGVWNATTNSPVIPAAAAGNVGWYYVVNVAGTTNVSGISDWGIGDWLVSNGSTWDKVDNTDAVTSVAGKMGVVVLVKADVGLSNVDNTSDAQKNVASATLQNKTINGAENTLTVRLDTSDVTGNLPVNKLSSGTNASGSTYWRGDGVWAAPSGAGNVVGPGGGVVDGDFAIFSGTSGTVLAPKDKNTVGDVRGPASSTNAELAQFSSTTGKGITGSGKLTADIVTGPSNATDNEVALYSGSTGKLIKRGTASPTGAFVGTTDTQTLSNKTFDLGAGVNIRPSGVIFALPTAQTSTALLTVWSVNLPANMLSRDGDSIRLTIASAHNAVAISKSMTVLLGGIASYTLVSSAASINYYVSVITISRISSTSQKWMTMRTADGGAGHFAEVVTTSHNLATALTLEHKIASSGSGTFSHMGTVIEFLPVP